MQQDWSDIEVSLIVADYIAMLTAEIEGRPVNKSEHRAQLKQLLNGRSDGSIEFKHQNISAVLVKHGLPFIRGYKPRANFQSKLELDVLRCLTDKQPSLETTFKIFADSPASVHFDVSMTNILESPPSRSLPATTTEFNEVEPEWSKRWFKINYLEREQRNAALGKNGELFAYQFEKWRLQSIGEDKLAESVEIISEHNDAAGFDILSKNKNGTDRYIEVKTTKLSKETPVFFSKNEYLFSKQKKSNYFLYRVFQFSARPKLFHVNGSFDDFCRKEATQFRGTF